MTLTDFRNRCNKIDPGIFPMFIDNFYNNKDLSEDGDLKDVSRFVSYYKSAATIVHAAFPWNRTAQGSNFWSELFQQLKFIDEQHKNSDSIFLTENLIKLKI